MFTDGLTPETPALLPFGNRAVAGGPQRLFRPNVEKRHLFHCKEQNFDFPVCNESLNQFRTLLNVTYNTCGDSGPMPVVAGKRTSRGNDMFILRKVQTNQDKQNFVLALLFYLKATCEMQ
jgi:hypothetical protein